MVRIPAEEARTVVRLDLPAGTWALAGKGEAQSLPDSAAIEVHCVLDSGSSILDEVNVFTSGADTHLGSMIPFSHLATVTLSGPGSIELGCGNGTSDFVDIQLVTLLATEITSF